MRRGRRHSRRRTARLDSFDAGFDVDVDRSAVRKHDELGWRRPEGGLRACSWSGLERRRAEDEIEASLGQVGRGRLEEM